MRKLIKNMIKCKHCGDVLQSFYVHDFKTCSCGRVSVDGGLDYARRCAVSLNDFVELAEWEDVDDPAEAKK